LTTQNQWEAKPGEDLAIPEAYIKDLKYEIVVFTRKERGGSDFTFRCKKYERDGDGQWRFGGVIIDTSKRVVSLLPVPGTRLTRPVQPGCTL
ncbi:unnamed protein product, partial [marine sediment metagenome]